MIAGNQNDYINYRIHRAEEAYEEALILAKNNKWNTVVNRLYYTCFYCVIALLLKHNVETQTHNGARTQFSLHFIKSGIIDKKFGKLYTKLFDLRQKGDYGDLFDHDEVLVKPLIKQTEEFITVIKHQIN